MERNPELLPLRGSVERETSRRAVKAEAVRLVIDNLPTPPPTQEPDEFYEGWDCT